MPQYGVITEQGDLGLGFDELNNKDNQTVNEAFGTAPKDGDQAINESKEDKN